MSDEFKAVEKSQDALIDSALRLGEAALDLEWINTVGMYPLVERLAVVLEWQRQEMPEGTTYTFDARSHTWRLVNLSNSGFTLEMLTKVAQVISTLARGLGWAHVDATTFFDEGRLVGFERPEIMHGVYLTEAEYSNHKKYQETILRMGAKAIMHHLYFGT
jgi:hypothetical protein